MDDYFDIHLSSVCAEAFGAPQQPAFERSPCLQFRLRKEVSEKKRKAKTERPTAGYITRRRQMTY
jgi:hypothetical protein